MTISRETMNGDFIEIYAIKITNGRMQRREKDLSPSLALSHTLEFFNEF